MERNWKLNDDLFPEDNILDPITFDDVILAVHCNCRELTRKEVVRTCREMLEQRLEDTKFLLKNNIDEIIQAAKIGREI